jgi:hypothetical protein
MATTFAKKMYVCAKTEKEQQAAVAHSMGKQNVSVAILATFCCKTNANLQ